MRFRSSSVGGFTVSAVVGTHCASFGISIDDPTKLAGLRGFSVKVDGTYVENFKVFPSLIPNPTDTTRVSSFDHPIQSFVWDIFTLDPNRTYQFSFEPFRGTPQAPDRTSPPITLPITTEKESAGDHDVYFNRGAASSQAYAQRFHNRRPDDQATPEECAAAFAWLSRGLDLALLRFIGSAAAGDALHCAFYEFHYAPVLSALASAIGRGVDVKVVFHAKNDPGTDRYGNPTPPFPRDANLAAIAAANLPAGSVIPRVARKNNLQHNKFMVLHRNGAPAEVWTGSANISLSAMFGQTNVGHWVRSATVAASYEAYWKLLAADEGAKEGAAHPIKDNKEFYDHVDALLPVIPKDPATIPAKTTAVFSPRSDDAPLKLYAKALSEATSIGCITLPFGIVKDMRAPLDARPATSAPVFVMLEKRDTDANAPALDDKHNVWEAWGSYLRDPLHRWLRETNMFELHIADHVAYIHSKFLLRDPLSDDPIVITGSANFSSAGTEKDSDENMLWIRGDRRVADIYFTEFNRLFFHYYYRSVVESVPGGAAANTRFLDETDAWLDKYKPGRFRAKRVDAFRAMSVP